MRYAFLNVVLATLLLHILATLASQILQLTVIIIVFAIYCLEHGLDALQRHDSFLSTFVPLGLHDHRRRRQVLRRRLVLQDLPPAMNVVPQFVLLRLFLRLDVRFLEVHYVLYVFLLQVWGRDLGPVRAVGHAAHVFSGLLLNLVVLDVAVDVQ